MIILILIVAAILHAFNRQKEMQVLCSFLATVMRFTESNPFLALLHVFYFTYRGLDLLPNFGHALSAGDKRHHNTLQLLYMLLL